MPSQTKTVVELTLDELDQMLQDAAAEGARAVSEDIREKAGQLDRAARVEAGLITMRDICELYGVSRDTVYEWGIEPVGCRSKQNLYDIDEIKAQIGK
jgi:hypothetical protein